MNSSMHGIVAWSVGMPELVIILVVAVLIWGKRLPEIARGMGKSVSEFKKGIKDGEQAQDDTAKEIQRPVDEAANMPITSSKTPS